MEDFFESNLQRCLLGVLERNSFFEHADIGLPDAVDQLASFQAVDRNLPDHLLEALGLDLLRILVEVVRRGAGGVGQLP